MSTPSLERVAVTPLVNVAADAPSTDVTNSVDWAVVSSVGDEEVSDVQINEFTEWYAMSINNVATVHRRDILLSPKPTYICRVPSGDKDLCRQAYRELHTEHPEIAIVVHILPAHNTKDFLWMKELSEVYGLVRQGIQSVNALSRFVDCTPSQEAALNNMSSWLSHRMHNLAVGEMKEQGVHVRICVDNEYFGKGEEEENRTPSQCSSGSEGKENPPATPDRRSSVVKTEKKAHFDDQKDLDYSLNITDITQAVWMSLHNYQNPVRPLFARHNYNPYAKCRGDSWVEVSGFPSDTSEYDVAAFLHEYSVRSIYFTTKHGMSGKKVARVCLGSRWEVVHCVERQLLMRYHQRYPTHERTLDAIDTAVQFVGATKTYRQFSSVAQFKEAVKQN